jgi:hypothetical protein
MNRTTNHDLPQRIKPLHERLGEAELAAPGAIDLSVRFPSHRSGSGLSWPAPVFSRLGLDSELNDAQRFSWIKARRELGLTTVDPCPAPHDTSSFPEARSLAGGLHVVPVFVDEPLLPEAFMHAEQIELQFMPCRTAGPSNSAGRGDRHRDWKPILPSDFTQVDQLAARVELLRQASDQPAVLVGGAIAAAAVYDDVRYLVDAGLDYVCVLADVIYGMQAHASHALRNADIAIEQAQRAIKDSGRHDVSLLLSTRACNLEDTVNWLSRGIRAVNIDGFLLARQPAVASRAADSFGSFLGDYQRMATPEADWLLSSLKDFLERLASHVEFLGFRELSHWTSTPLLAPELAPPRATPAGQPTTIPAAQPASPPPPQPAATAPITGKKKPSSQPRTG